MNNFSKKTAKFKFAKMFVSLLFITNLVLKQLPIEVTHLALIITQQQCNTGSVTSHVASG